MRNILITLSFIAILFACNNSSDNRTANTPVIKRPTLNHNSIGSLSFKLNGQLYEADPAHAKAWSTSQIPLAMLIARNDKGLSVSMQILNMTGEGDYKLDGDRKGSVNFTIDGKTYWTKSVMGDDYLNVRVSSTKMQATVILLSGTFDGVLEDREGNKIQITEGKFTTERL